ncbi:MAG: tryptophan halogenase family protein [Pseudomonadota bacterium]
MAEPITEVTIVGGGTAGWLAALLLQSMVCDPKKPDRPIKITLIESPNINSVGVGEATVPGMPRTLRQAGISEKAFFKACNASFKLGVLFNDWNVDEKGKPFSFMNPFQDVPNISGREAGFYMLRYGADGRDFSQVFSPALDLFKASKGPRPLGRKEFDPTVGFAYHLDAGAFAKMLSEACVKRGANHVRDDVVDVEQDERGYISALQLAEGGRRPVQLVLDCTGFRGLIINKVLEEPCISYSKHLANDRALAVQLPHPPGGKIPSATQSTALGAGWVWRVPLYHRVGTGYVFSSAHRTDEEAKAEFLQHLGPQGEGAEPRVIPMRIGRTARAWVKNCVAVGLSSGFIEPLESTAIHTIDTTVRWLANFFPDQSFADPLRDRFNKLTTALYDEILDFIVVHYALGNRTDDPYWIDARNLELPDRLAENLALWRHNLPTHYDLDFDSFTSPSIYQVVMLGKRVYDMGFGAPEMVQNMTLNRRAWNEVLKNSKRNIGQMVKTFPDHRTLLTELRGELQPAERQPAFSGFGQQATVPLPGAKKVPVKVPEFVPSEKDSALL